MRDRLRYGRVRGEEERNFKDSELAMLEEAAAGWWEWTPWDDTFMVSDKELDERWAWREWEGRVP